MYGVYTLSVVNPFHIRSDCTYHHTHNMSIGGSTRYLSTRINRSMAGRRRKLTGGERKPGHRDTLKIDEVPIFEFVTICMF